MKVMKISFSNSRGCSKKFEKIICGIRIRQLILYLGSKSTGSCMGAREDNILLLRCWPRLFSFFLLLSFDFHIHPPFLPFSLLKSRPLFSLMKIKIPKLTPVPILLPAQRQPQPQTKTQTQLPRSCLDHVVSKYLARGIYSFRRL